MERLRRARSVLEEVTVCWGEVDLGTQLTAREPRGVSLNLAPGSLGELSNGGDLATFQISRADLTDKSR